MKQLFILFLTLAVLAPSVSFAEKEKCAWRFKYARHAPSIFHCGEKKVKYYFGDLGCTNSKAEYKNIFCRADLSSDGTSCYNDRLSKENIECRATIDKKLAEAKSPVRMNMPTTSSTVGGSK